mmetsp:Transcript_2438/g.6233  ORF Transcript_2438/g.6233 Transcript_2438/m.6233 type:complete len:222 (+) Transcript_2438:119-784(+)
MRAMRQRHPNKDQHPSLQAALPPSPHAEGPCAWLIARLRAGSSKGQDTSQSKDGLGADLSRTQLQQGGLVSLVADLVVVPHKVAHRAHVVVEHGVGNGKLDGESDDAWPVGNHVHGVANVPGQGDGGRAIHTSCQHHASHTVGDGGDSSPGEVVVAALAIQPNDIRRQGALLDQILVVCRCAQEGCATRVRGGFAPVFRNFVTTDKPQLLLLQCCSCNQCL